MSEREFYISIIPDIVELIVLLRDMSQQERTQIKDEMIKNCKSSLQACKFMEKLWTIIEAQLIEKV